jgi:hypothetical protein
MIAHIELPGYFRQAVTVDQGRKPARKIALILVRVTVHQKIRYEQTKHAVAKKFQPFVGRRGFRCTGVGQRGFEQFAVVKLMGEARLKIG